MNTLPYTPNGKIDKKSLPEPLIQNSKKQIVKPKNRTESILVSLIKNLLNIDELSIDENFFDIGGDSLFAINLCIQIQNEFNVQLYVKDIIEKPTIEELSYAIDNAKTVEACKLEHVEKADYYNTSSAQKRMYYTSQIAGKDSTLYNMPGGIIFESSIDSKKLEKCINTLINRHESLRTYFEIVNENVVQKILNNYTFKLEIIENASFDDKDVLFKDFLKPFDLSIAPLFRAKFIKFTNGKSMLFVDMHHIIADGTSLSIFKS